MSLRTLHLVFITVSVLVMFVFGLWALIHGLDEVTPSALLVAGGLAAFLSGIVLILYGVSFRRKTVHLT
ncbi:MAG: hypothetical protein OXM02_04265 [Bacteroidota bacterium]|nr:hypothetical protein [Bacteroidota bacterium]MDE2833716.1 hypothetical protein [Bacteroidota bacterium]MDE2957301.1 hypothetical protein [Bacteroidota bacterium]